jgi:hypothetical protein
MNIISVAIILVSSFAFIVCFSVPNQSINKARNKYIVNNAKTTNKKRIYADNTTGCTMH